MKYETVIEVWISTFTKFLELFIYFFGSTVVMYYLWNDICNPVLHLRTFSFGQMAALLFACMTAQPFITGKYFNTIQTTSNGLPKWVNYIILFALTAGVIFLEMQLVPALISP